MVPNEKAQERFHVVFRATNVKCVFVFMTNHSKFYAVQIEKLSACQIYDVLQNHASIPMDSDWQGKSCSYPAACSLTRSPTGHFGKNVGHHRLKTFARGFEDFDIRTIAHCVNHKLNDNRPRDIHVATPFRPPKTFR